MYVLYAIAYSIFRVVLWGAGFFNEKIRIGIEGRRHLQQEIEAYYANIPTDRKRILIHVASLGELEQAKPVLERVKERYPYCHIHLTFFSPSGYTNAKGKYLLPDLITYSPFDSKRSVNTFLDVVRPNLVLFTRYDVWFRFAKELQKRNIKAILFSATFVRSGLKNDPIIRILYRRTYNALSKIFTIGRNDAEALIELGIPSEKIMVAGDTRSDQVILRKRDAEKQEDVLPVVFLNELKKIGAKVFVVGSTWQADEDVILPALLEASKVSLHIIIVPHEITKGHLDSLQSRCNGRSILLSEMDRYASQPILIWDKIGDLFTLYKYADIAYVGGGFGDGVHNVLEPAAWGVPSIVGPNHSRSQEIGELIRRGGAMEINTEDEFSATLNTMLDERIRQNAATQVLEYLKEKTGATESIIVGIDGLGIL